MRHNFLKVLAGAILAPFVCIVLMGAAPLTSSVTETTTRLADGQRITKIEWVADSTGAFTATATTAFIRGIITQFICDPDTSRLPATADSSGRGPTDNYDITLTNTIGIDVAGSSLLNRDTANTELAVPKTPDGTEWPFVNNSKVTTAVTNNLIPNARGHIYIYWWER